MRKNIKRYIQLFVLTLCIGGFGYMSASSPYVLDGLKADFLQTTPHYTSLVNKTTWSSQQIDVTSTTGNRSVLLAEFDQNENWITPDYMLFASGSSKYLSDSTYQTQGQRKLRAKLLYPWTQVTIYGNWYYDM